MLVCDRRFRSEDKPPPAFLINCSDQAEPAIISRFCRRCARQSDAIFLQQNAEELGRMLGGQVVGLEQPHPTCRTQ